MTSEGVLNQFLNGRRVAAYADETILKRDADGNKGSFISVYA